MDDVGCVAVLRASTSLSHLQVLSLGKPPADVDFAEHLGLDIPQAAAAKGWAACASYLRYFECVWARYPGLLSPAQVCLLTQWCALGVGEPSVAELDLSGMQLDEERAAVVGSQALAEDLVKMTGLRALRLWRCNMTCDTIRDLSPGLCRCNLLQHLDLNENALGDEGVGLVGPLVVQLAVLVSLEMMNTGISGRTCLRSRLRVLLPLTCTP